MQETVAARPSASQVSAGLLYTLRILVTAQAAAVLLAASFAGQSVQYGGDSFIEMHLMVALVVHLAALLQIVAAVLYWRPGGGRGWVPLASVGLFVVGALQHVTWILLGTHLPNGLALFGLTLVMLVWAWSPRAARRR